MGRRRRWILGLVVLSFTVAAIVLAGGFLWPRPQFSGGPWSDEERQPVDSLAHDSLSTPTP